MWNVIYDVYSALELWYIYVFFKHFCCHVISLSCFSLLFKKTLWRICEIWPWPDLGEAGFFCKSLCDLGYFESNCVELACSPHSQGDPGTWWSRPPAGPLCPAAPGTPGSAAPGRSGSQPAGSPRYRSGTASGPTGCYIGPWFLPQCIPEILSIERKEWKRAL